MTPENYPNVPDTPDPGNAATPCPDAIGHTLLDVYDTTLATFRDRSESEPDTLLLFEKWNFINDAERNIIAAFATHFRNELLHKQQIIKATKVVPLTPEDINRLCVEAFGYIRMIMEVTMDRIFDTYVACPNAECFQKLRMTDWCIVQGITLASPAYEKDDEDEKEDEEDE